MLESAPDPLFCGGVRVSGGGSISLLGLGAPVSLSAAGPMSDLRDQGHRSLRVASTQIHCCGPIRMHVCQSSAYNESKPDPSPATPDGL